MNTKQGDLEPQQWRGARDSAYAITQNAKLLPVETRACHRVEDGNLLNKKPKRIRVVALGAKEETHRC